MDWKKLIVTLIGRIHLELFRQENLIPAKIGLKLKVILILVFILWKTIGPDHDHPLVNYKVRIIDALCLFVPSTFRVPRFYFREGCCKQTITQSL